MRETGFYWVLWREQGEPQVAKFESGAWWLVGLEDHIRESDLLVLSGPLEPIAVPADPLPTTA